MTYRTRAELRRAESAWYGFDMSSPRKLGTVRKGDAVTVAYPRKSGRATLMAGVVVSDTVVFGGYRRVKITTGREAGRVAEVREKYLTIKR